VICEAFRFVPTDWLIGRCRVQLILDRCLGEYQVPEGWVIFAAGNRQGDRGVTYSMPTPLANRFTHFGFDVNLDDWVLWAHQQGIDERIIAFLRFRPELLFDFDPALDPVAFPTPRSWEFAHHALQKFGTQRQTKRMKSWATYSTLHPVFLSGKWVSCWCRICTARSAVKYFHCHSLKRGLIRFLMCCCTKNLREYLSDCWRVAACFQFRL